MLHHIIIFLVLAASQLSAADSSPTTTAAAFASSENRALNLSCIPPPAPGPAFSPPDFTVTVDDTPSGCKAAATSPRTAHSPAGFRQTVHPPPLLNPQPTSTAPFRFHSTPGGRFRRRLDRRYSRSIRLARARAAAGSTSLPLLCFGAVSPIKHVSQILEDLFTLKGSQGIGLSLMRHTIGQSDLTPSWVGRWSFDFNGSQTQRAARDDNIGFFTAVSQAMTPWMYLIVRRIRRCARPLTQ
jgi:hypothetical protein